MAAPTSVIFGAAALATSLPLLIWGLASTPRRASRLVHQNLAGGQILVDERQAMLETSALQRAIVPAIKSLAVRGRRLTPAGWFESLEHQLQLVGSPRSWPIERVLALKLILGIAGAIYAISLLANEFTSLNVVVAILTSIGGFFVPDLIIWGRAQERQQAIQLALPDTLDQMTISVEAGLGFDAALMRSADAGDGPLPDELHRTLGELKLGASRRQAFQNLAGRTNVPELKHFVFAVLQADEYGLPIAQVLRVQAAELRVKRRQRAEERALKMPVKIVFPLVTCIFPSLFIVLLGPAAIQISRALNL
jgi:tight adherence protein C